MIYLDGRSVLRTKELVSEGGQKNQQLTHLAINKQASNAAIKREYPKAGRRRGKGERVDSLGAKDLKDNKSSEP